MFRNVNIEFGSEHSLLIRWEWIEDQKGVTPDCHVFYCSIPENKLLDKGLFLDNEILSYFNSQVVKIYDTDINNEFVSYCQKYPESGRLLHFQRGISDIENRQLPISKDAQNHIFLVCVYDNNECIMRIISCEKEKVIPFKEIKQSFFKTLVGGSNQRKAIKLLCDDQRKKVIIYRAGRNTIFTVLPEFTHEYYFDNNVNLQTLKIYYLSSIIGRSDIGL